MKGFTLFETLIVIGIGVLICLISFSAFYDLDNNQLLAKETAEVGSYLERARSMSVISNNFSEYGLHFSPTSITLFQGKTYSSTDTANDLYPLNSRLVITPNLSDGASDFYFTKVAGKPSATGTITISLLGSTSTKTITIYSTGLFESN
ncbi:MAG: hypothetical protein WCI52_03275 [bacterium]